MNSKFNNQTDFATEIQKAIHLAVNSMNLKVDQADIQLEHPAIEEHGDYASNIAMVIWQKDRKDHQLGNFKNPRNLAEHIAFLLKKDKKLFSLVETIKIAGPGFINFKFKNQVLILEIQKIQKHRQKYGSNNSGKGQKWLIEHTSPNPNKSMHLGHLRNNVTGMAIANILEFNNITVIRDAVDNNRGIAIAKLMWGYLKFAHKKGNQIVDIDYWYKHQEEWLTPKDKNMQPDRFVDELYIKASKDFKGNEEVEQKVRQLVVDWENGDKKNRALWQKILKYSYLGQETTLKRLANKWDKVWHEHEHYQLGKEYVQEGLNKGIFRKLDNGVILSDLKKYGISDTVLVKSDGTALYITQDIALTKLKQETFNPDKIFWVIGPEQSLALKQLFAICEQLGIGKAENYVHIPYGWMSLKGQGKMSSRTGNVVYIDELIDKAKNKILTKINNNLFEDKKTILKLAEQVAVGAVKYSILKVGRLTDIRFDFETSLSFDGDSGPYLQYTYARCQSVLSKSKEKIWEQVQNNISSELKLKNLKLNTEELAIFRYLYRFPEIVYKSAQEYAPNYICTYLHELAQRYNTFYCKCPILNTNNKEQKSLRLQITAGVAQILNNGLNLLGIDTPDRM